MSGSSDLRLQPDASRLTLGHFLADVCERHADRTALVLGDRELSYAELFREVRRTAQGLVGAGVVKGARVALLIGNRHEWVVAAFAAGSIGAVVVPVSTFATPEERDYILRHSDASLLLLQRRLLERRFLDELVSDHPALLEGAPGRLRCAALPGLRRVVCLGLADSQVGVESWSALGQHAEDVPEPLIDALCAEVHPSDDGLIIYTSGTTARPKGILHSQRAPVIQSWRFAEYMEITPEDRVLTAQPFFWTAGICMSLGSTLAAGASLVLQETFQPAAALEAIERHAITTLHAWPHQEKAMAEHPDCAQRALSSLSKIEFTSPLAKPAGLERDEWGTYGAYGLSETFTLAAAIPASAPAEDRKRSSGRLLPGMQLRIVDPESGAPLSGEAKGEIAVKGATLMKGYLKVDPELVLDGDGFFHTQDGGHLGADGFLYWSGRLSNLIKTGGANVSPIEIEEALARHPSVRVAAAVGIPHPTLGEIVVLCAVAGEGARIEPEALRRYLRERLAAYKVPRVVLPFEPGEFEYTANQKVQLEPLRERARLKLEEAGIEVDGFAYGEGRA